MAAAVFIGSQYLQYRLGYQKVVSEIDEIKETASRQDDTLEALDAAQFKTAEALARLMAQQEAAAEFRQEMRARLQRIEDALTRRG